MKKIIDGTNAVLGRLASYVAKEVLRGEEVIILNCENILITGNKKSIKKDFEKKRGRVGGGQKGPIHAKTSERIVKRTIRGMLPDHRMGRGKVAFKKVMCFRGIPKEFKDCKKIVAGKEKKSKFSKVGEFSK